MKLSKLHHPQFTGPAATYKCIAARNYKRTRPRCRPRGATGPADGARRENCYSTWARSGTTILRQLHVARSYCTALPVRRHWPTRFAVFANAPDSNFASYLRFPLHLGHLGFSKFLFETFPQISSKSVGRMNLPKCSHKYSTIHLNFLKKSKNGRIPDNIQPKGRIHRPVQAAAGRGPDPGAVVGE